MNTLADVTAAVAAYLVLIALAASFATWWVGRGRPSDASKMSEAAEVPEEANNPGQRGSRERLLVVLRAAKKMTLLALAVVTLLALITAALASALPPDEIAAVIADRATTAVVGSGIFAMAARLPLLFGESPAEVVDWREAAEMRREVRRQGGEGSEELKLVMVRWTARASLFGLLVTVPTALVAHGLAQIL